MCRMVGVVFRDRFPVETVTDLRQVSEVGRIPGEDEPGHRDGWGFVSFRNGSPRYIGRSPRPAFLDPSFDSALEDVEHLVGPNIMLAHARAASTGKATLANTHPFVGGDVVLAHNGGVKKFSPKTSKRPKGETDSEMLALVLEDRYAEKGDLEAALKSMVKEDIPGHEITGLVLLVSDGRALIGYRDYGMEDRANYYTLNVGKCKDWISLFQETSLVYEGGIMPVRKGELVSVGLDLSVRMEMLL